MDGTKTYSTDFNPHPRTEGDYVCLGTHFLRVYFNPHPRTEGDTEMVNMSQEVEISTHTLARRVTNVRLESGS